LRMKNVAFLFELKPKCSQVSIPVFWLINLWDLLVCIVPLYTNIRKKITSMKWRDGWD
jgi:hypothetical protein